MIIPLSGGHKATLRDKLKARDYRVVAEAVKFTQREDRSFEVSMAFEIDGLRALAISMITDWDVPWSPRRPLDAEDPGAVLDELDGDDWEAIREAIRPFYDKIMESRPKQGTKTAATSGRSSSATSSSATADAPPPPG